MDTGLLRRLLLCRLNRGGSLRRGPRVERTAVVGHGEGIEADPIWEDRRFGSTVWLGSKRPRAQCDIEKKRHADGPTDGFWRPLK